MGAPGDLLEVTAGLSDLCCLLGRLFLIHQMRIQITIHYLKSGQEASPGVRASALAVKAAGANHETQLGRTQWHTRWDSFRLCVMKVWMLLTAWQV